MKRVLVASMMHESNSFNPIIAGENDFGVVRGEKLFERNPKNDPLRGVMDTLQEQGSSTDTFCKRSSKWGSRS